MYETEIYVSQTWQNNILEQFKSHLKRRKILLVIIN